MTRPPLAHRLAGDWAILVLALFWVARYAIVTTVDHLAADTAIFYLPRALISLSGFGLSTAITRVRPTPSSSVRGWGILALLMLAVIGGFFQASVNYVIFHFFAPEMRPVVDGTVYLRDTVSWFWTYAALFGIVFALDASRDAAERARQIAVLDRMAHQAQLRALRYQLNPHFIFNTLNSIATLVARRDTETAERMIEDLADFLRATLAVDPHEDVSLARELELQALYLALEARRFPDRLRVAMDVTPESTHALVPSLITQPLTENVLRHAVAVSEARVRLDIVARKVDGQLHLIIANDVPPDARPRRGMSVGLANVAERLRARFAERSSFDAGLQADGRFAAVIRIPFVAR